MIKSIIINLPILINIILIITLILPTKIRKFHPIILIFYLIIITILITIKINFLNQSWIPFILFLTIIGGLIIIYIYITSLANNELILYYYIKNLFYSIFKIIFLIRIYLFRYIYYKNLINSQDLWINNLLSIYNQNNINLIFIKINNISSYFIILYLFYTIICVINICFKSNIPLRQLKFYV